ncbi:kxDL motif-containing protein CG10681 [Neocloeon triangulifer]|uniref:kxDL motif-containing protein CG10681 n=1 Tax=Neocloeon triangulifer TaxID=2078957 RepID=UPI00286EF2C3|nr:kxDL motif-containing protein CG10681 [Neocloeon triangulifer]
MADTTPESEIGSIECFQNYTAPEVFIQGLAGLVNQQDVESMIRAQKQMLQRFEKTNEMLINCNALSAGRLQMAQAEFKKHSQLLMEMKKDLENIFKRTRALKSKLSTQYPQAFQVCENKSALVEEDDEETKEATKEEEEAKMKAKEKPLKRNSSSTDSDDNGTSDNNVSSPESDSP